jgi:MarR family transcriptional regulator, organic hydroperoxide resistance regulator
MDRITRLATLYPLLMGKMGRLRTVVHERLDLTYNQYKTLLTVADRGEGTLGDLARELAVTMSSASQMVERLVGQGLIDRRQDADNRRQVRIRLTERGEELIAELRQGILAEYRKLLARLPEEEQEDLVRSLETIARILAKIT